MNYKDIIIALERDEIMHDLRLVVSIDELLPAQAAANDFSPDKLRAYLKMILFGHHWESSALIVSRCPEPLLNDAVRSIHRKYCMGITDGW